MYFSGQQKDMESHPNIIRDLTESLLTQYVTDDVQSLEHVTQTQISNAVRAAVRSFKFSLSLQGWAVINGFSTYFILNNLFSLVPA